MVGLVSKGNTEGTQKPNILEKSKSRIVMEIGEVIVRSKISTKGMEWVSVIECNWLFILEKKSMEHLSSLNCLSLGRSWSTKMDREELCVEICE